MVYDLPKMFRDELAPVSVNMQGCNTTLHIKKGMQSGLELPHPHSPYLTDSGGIATWL